MRLKKFNLWHISRYFPPATTAQWISNGHTPTDLFVERHDDIGCFCRILLTPLEPLCRVTSFTKISQIQILIAM